MIDFILGEAWPYIVGVVALVAGWFAARQSGKRAERAKREKQRLDTIREVRGIERKVEGGSDDEILADITRKP